MLMNNDMIFLSGAYLVNKEEGTPSRYVDNYFLREHKIRKAGHLGTLDPFASGLLVIFTNHATKLIPFFEGATKEYIATIKLGEKTDTGDLDGRVIETLPIPRLTKANIEEYFETLIGENEQTPPMFSALKIKGVPLYKLAREGANIPREKRKFTIHEIQLLEFTNETIVFRVLVSKGTYIRVLAEDIANHFDTTGHLIKLVRTKVGSFSLEDAKRVHEISSKDILTIVSLFKEYPSYDLSDDEYQRVLEAAPFDLPFDSSYLLMIYRETPIAIYTWNNNTYIFKRGLN